MTPEREPHKAIAQLTSAHTFSLQYCEMAMKRELKLRVPWLFDPVEFNVSKRNLMLKELNTEFLITSKTLYNQYYKFGLAIKVQ